MRDLPLWLVLLFQCRVEPSRVFGEDKIKFTVPFNVFNIDRLQTIAEDVQVDITYYHDSNELSINFWNIQCGVDALGDLGKKEKKFPCSYFEFITEVDDITYALEEKSWSASQRK